jgi:hypothetical protein
MEIYIFQIFLIPPFDVMHVSERDFRKGCRKNIFIKIKRTINNLYSLGFLFLFLYFWSALNINYVGGPSIEHFYQVGSN